MHNTETFTCSHPPITGDYGYFFGYVVPSEGTICAVAVDPIRANHLKYLGPIKEPDLNSPRFQQLVRGYNAQH